jgi:hypothetical protein
MKNNSNTLFDQYARKKEAVIPHHSTFATLKKNTNLSSKTKRRRSSNIAVPAKRVA